MPVPSGRSRDPKPEIRAPAKGVTARAILLGLLLTPLNVLFVVHASMLQGGFRFTGRYSLFVNTVAALFLLALADQWLKRWRPRWAFGSGEMLTLYLMLGISTGLICSAFDVGGSLSGIVTYPYWFASKENRWREVLWPNLPPWLSVQDPQALERASTRATRTRRRGPRSGPGWCPRSGTPPSPRP